MDAAISSVSPAVVLPPPPTPPFHRRVPPHACSGNPRFLSSSITYYVSRSSVPPSWRRSGTEFRCKSSADSDGGDVEGDDDDDVERALRMDGTIPGTSDEFVKQVSSRAYDMRRHLHQSLDSSSYDVLEVNPWRGSLKPVYVLTHKQNQLCTMRTRRNRSEVEKELGMLFSSGRKWGSDFGNQVKQTRSSTNFQMFVEDVREGILVFEDQDEALNYCNLLQGGGQGCEGVAEIEASSVFDLCRSTRALAILIRRGRTPPQPERLQHNLRARKHSLED